MPSPGVASGPSPVELTVREAACALGSRRPRKRSGRAIQRVNPDRTSASDTQAARLIRRCGLLFRNITFASQSFQRCQGLRRDLMFPTRRISSRHLTSCGHARGWFTCLKGKLALINICLLLRESMFSFTVGGIAYPCPYFERLTADGTLRNCWQASARQPITSRQMVLTVRANRELEP